MNEQVLCGAARSKITPSMELLPNLRGLRNSEFGGVIDDIYMRVIALDDGKNGALIISFDLDKVPYPKENIALIVERTGIPEENIFLFSIHTHTAPITGFRPEEGPNDLRRKPQVVQEATKTYEKQLTDTMLKTVDKAIALMRPAKMGYEYGKSYINQNRNQDYEFYDDDGNLQKQCNIGVNPDAEVDRTVFVLKFEDFDGRPIAYFMNYPVHNTVMLGNQCFDGKAGISGDIGGNVSSFMEARYQGSVAIWSSGAAGDVNPLMSNEFYYPDPQTGKQIVEQIPGGNTSILKMLAAQHFNDIVKIERTIQCRIEKANISGIVDWSYTPGQNVNRLDDGTMQIETGENIAPYEIRLHMVKLGDTLLYGFSGELFSSFGKRIKEVSPIKDTILINHDATFMSRANYIFDDETLFRDKDCFLPGHGNTHILAGYVLSSLEKHTIDMIEKLNK